MQCQPHGPTDTSHLRQSVLAFQSSGPQGSPFHTKVRPWPIHCTHTGTDPLLKLGQEAVRMGLETMGPPEQGHFPAKSSPKTVSQGLVLAPGMDPQE